MGSWIECRCGKRLHKNLFCGADVRIVVKNGMLDSINESSSATEALDQIALHGDKLLHCTSCGRILIEDHQTNAVTFYIPEQAPPSEPNEY